MAEQDSMEQEAKLASLRQSLQEGTDISASLQTLNTLLEASSGARVQEIASFLSLQLLFQCLNSSSGDLLTLTCDVIGKIFSALPADEVCRQRLYLELGLQHEAEEVRRLSLVAIREHLEVEEAKTMVTSRTVFHLLTMVVGDDSLQCASLASDLLLSVLQHSHTLEPPVREGLLLDLEALVTKNDTVRFRVYELAVKLSQRGEDGFKFSVSTGLLGRLLKELGSGDVLVQMNCVELLLPLMEMREGVKFLESERAVETMHSLLLSAHQDPLGSVLIPSIVKFYGHLSHCEGSDFPAITRRYPEFLRTVLSACLSPEDETQWGVAVDTLGLLGSSSAGREALEVCGMLSRDAVEALGGIVSQGRPDLCVRTLQSLAVFFSCTDETPSDAWTSEQWFHHLHSDPLSIVMPILRQPFADLTKGALEFLRAMAPHEWGQRELSGQPGLLEYLLDRNVKLDKAGKELRFEIVQCLVGTSTAESCFGSPNFLKLRKFHREGPFFVTGEQALAMDESAE